MKCGRKVYINERPLSVSGQCCGSVVHGYVASYCKLILETILSGWGVEPHIIWIKTLCSCWNIVKSHDDKFFFSDLMIIGNINEPLYYRFQILRLCDICYWVLLSMELSEKIFLTMVRKGFNIISFPYYKVI
jgi:hypothetical protein